MKRAGMFKRGMSVLLVFALLSVWVLNIGIHAYAAAGAQDGQVEYVGGTTGTQDGAAFEITASKTIEAVEGKENYFDITL